jgi:hypothetical protein
MSFDIAALDVVTPSDAGAVMELIDLRTGEVAKDSEGKPVWIKLAGVYSSKTREAERALNEQRILSIRDGKPAPSDSEATAGLFAACTLDWSFDTMDGKPFPCTPENAKAFWLDPRFATILNQADRFVSKIANFTKA